MIKLTFCLVRLPHLTREGFQAYWFDKHAPLVKSHAAVLGIRRYIQTHSADPALSVDLRQSRGGPEQYDGVAQLWWDSLEDLAQRLSQPKAIEASRALLEDERKFIDLPRSPLWWARRRSSSADQCSLSDKFAPCTTRARFASIRLIATKSRTRH